MFRRRRRSTDTSLRYQRDDIRLTHPDDTMLRIERPRRALRVLRARCVERNAARGDDRRTKEKAGVSAGPFHASGSVYRLLPVVSAMHAPPGRDHMVVSPVSGDGVANEPILAPLGICPHDGTSSVTHMAPFGSLPDARAGHRTSTLLAFSSERRQKGRPGTPSRPDMTAAPLTCPARS
jgi:hypothetical protein